MSTYEALVASGTQEPERASFPQRVLAEHEVRVQVRASGVNRADLIELAGLYRAPKGAPPGLGLEFAGVVVESRSDRWRDGDRVMGIAPGGGHAAEFVADAECLLRVPDHLELTEAAALPEALFTAFDALTSHRTLASGDVVLIHAAASGVGTMALQLVRALGALPVGTCRSAAKLAHLDVLAPGSTFHMKSNFDDTDYAALADFLSSRGGSPTLVVDLVGGDYTAKSVGLARRGGTIVVLGLLAGRYTKIDLGKVLIKNLSIKGTTLRNRSIVAKRKLTQDIAQVCGPFLADGRIQPVLAMVKPSTDAHAAFRELAQNDVVGKIVLDWAASRAT